VKSLQHQVLNAPLSNIPYWKRSSSRDIPGTTPGDNHQIAGLLRSYAIEIFAARFLEDPNCPFADPNVNDNSGSVFRRCRWFGFCWSCPSYCRVAIAVCLQKQLSIRMNVYCTLETPYLFLAFLHEFIIRRACGLNLCDHDPSYSI
jgi:hypothetical protein